MFQKVNAKSGKRTTVSITEARRLLLERTAIEATNALGKSVKWTDIINYMIDEYSNEALKDIKNGRYEK